MIEIEVWNLVFITLVIIIASHLRSGSEGIGFLGFVNLIFMFAVLPKATLSYYYGQAVFIAHSVEFSSDHVNAAVAVICFFVVGVNVAWFVPMPSFFPASRAAVPPEARHGMSVRLKDIDHFVLMFILPISVLCFAALGWSILS